jgi:dTDP-4-dehydrorhamnose 3,5-epimerase/reductase
MANPQIEATRIEGLFVIRFVVNEDNRGSFTEVWQKAKMESAGLPSFQPVQLNRSINVRRGVTRGIHGEPWSKLISVYYGRVFAPIVDLRPNSPTFKQYEIFELDYSRGLFLAPRLGNSFQVLSDEAVYAYLVDAHWNDALVATEYVQTNVNDPELGINWPIPLGEMILSEKDRNLPTIRERFGR